MPELIDPHAAGVPVIGNYRNGLPAAILVHSAAPITYGENPTEAWIEGEPGVAGLEPQQGLVFACVLFLPGPGGEQQNDYRPKVIRQPTLLYNPLRDDGTVVTVGLEDELIVAAPELAPWTGAPSGRWLVAGVPQPFGPPGVVIGVQAMLRQVVG